MAFGLLQKAAAGAAAGGQQAAQVGMQMYANESLTRLRDELENKRQERLMAFQRGERVAGQEFQAGQAELGRKHQKGMQVESLAVQMYLGEMADERALEQIGNDTIRTQTAKKLADIQAKVAQLDIDAKEQINEIKTEYLDKETTPQRREQLADSLYTLLGKDKFSPVVGKDELGNPQYVGAFNTRSGQLVGPGQRNAAPGEQAGFGAILNRVFGSAKQPQSQVAPQAAAQPASQLDVNTRLVSGMSESALRQAAAKNDEIGRAARARLAEIEREREESASSAAQFPYPR